MRNATSTLSQRGSNLKQQRRLRSSREPCRSLHASQSPTCAHHVLKAFLPHLKTTVYHAWDRTDSGTVLKRRWQAVSSGSGRRCGGRGRGRRQWSLLHGEARTLSECLPTLPPLLATLQPPVDEALLRLHAPVRLVVAGASLPRSPSCCTLCSPAPSNDRSKSPAWCLRIDADWRQG